MVPTKLFRAIRPKSPIGQDASAFPLLRLAGTVLPPTGCDTRRRKLGYPLGHDITGNISDVVVP